ncbi:MAG: rane protein [Bacteriovoracaceae bacterium]|nr:rane protein [Bacteriovoracaceae bacterium]
MEYIGDFIRFVREMLPLFRWWDFVDILIVAFIVYRSFLPIKGTRTVQILVSFGALAFIYWIAYHVEARTTRALLGSVFDNLFIIFVILFQQDIRRVLSQIGRTPFLSKAESFKDGYIIEELIKSTVSLANKKIGALVVIERQAEVSEFIESGVVIDSQVSKEMLTSIFLPVSPLHDGAVIIRKGRIAMASCFLPLTLNTMASKSIGTRHRAAVGLTEETDAVCVVVSEENGTISIASGGRITHNLDAAQLRKLLLESL